MTYISIENIQKASDLLQEIANILEQEKLKCPSAFSITHEPTEFDWIRLIQTNLLRVEWNLKGLQRMR